MAITQNELNISNKSYTNKDFQTIYPELIEIVKQLTNKWDPSATNESDPGIVLMKLAAFIADKLNYNVDKNVLEAFLPSATQETSFRNLLERDAYTMKYYQSASTKMTIQYNGVLTNQVTLTPFEYQFSNEEDSVRYTVIPQEPSAITIASQGIAIYPYVVEGSPEDLEVNGVNVITLDNLDDENKIYFPLQMVAENAIYVRNNNANDWLSWRKVDNLNAIALGTPCFKFGFDSNRNLPYIQFPSDISSLIGSGLNIKYFKSSGYSGNVEARKLIKLANPSEDSFADDNGNPLPVVDGTTGTTLLVISNQLSAINGSDPETLNQAYNNFKKTTGTFDVLVTTRDFANYLYRYVDINTLASLFSNIQVTDRRTDINYSTPYKVFDEKGISTNYIFGDTSSGIEISPYDLVVYPLKKTGTISNKDTYDETYTPSTKIEDIPDAVEESQCISHTYVQPQNNDIYAVLNNYKLNVKIGTINKVNRAEGKEIINNVKKALYQNFNSREVDYGEEIPYDILLNVIQNADTRIKVVSLDDPVITPSFLLGSGNVSTDNDYQVNLAARNVLAGKISLYEYDNNFAYDFGQSGVNDIEKDIQTIETSLELSDASGVSVVLGDNQIVQLVKDKYVTKQTATVGVNFL